jgi:cyclase
MGWQMLKKRIIPIQLLLNDRLVKTRQFDHFRDVGDPVASAKVYNAQYADELIFLNIDRKVNSVEPLKKVLDEVASVCFMPLALGGGIRAFADVAYLIRNGADKVILNSICYTNPELIKQVAECYGSQAVIVAIDARWDEEEKKYKIFSNCGSAAQSISLEDHIQRCLDLGAGEIFIQSIDKDGMMNGFDIRLIKKVSVLANVPVIACGGSGNYENLKEVFIETDASAVSCGSIFNFSDSNWKGNHWIMDYNGASCYT